MLHARVNKLYISVFELWVLQMQQEVYIVSKLDQGCFNSIAVTCSNKMVSTCTYSSYVIVVAMGHFHTLSKSPIALQWWLYRLKGRNWNLLSLNIEHGVYGKVKQYALLQRSPSW